MTELDPAKIYPYVVPDTYVPNWDGGFVFWDLEHALKVILVIDLGHVVSSIRPQELEGIGMSEETAWDTAFRNLHNDWGDQRMWVNVLNGDAGERCMVVENHWSAAATMLLRGIQEAAAEYLGGWDFFATAPDTSFLLFFPQKLSPIFKSRLDQVISDRSVLFRKPLTKKLFLIGESGITESDETW